MIKKIKLPFGIKEGRLHHINDVENGLQCGCKCPECHSKLVARNNGKKTIPHFAHYQSYDCPASLETAIHLMAKQLLKDELKVKTPAFHRTPKIKMEDDEEIYSENCVDIPPKIISFDYVKLEKNRGEFRPDVTGFINDKFVHIEIRVTHEVDRIKMTKVRMVGEAMFEIDLSDLNQRDLLNLESFKKEVLFNEFNRKWIFNPRAEKLYDNHYKKLVANYFSKHPWVMKSKMLLREKEYWSKISDND